MTSSFEPIALSTYVPELRGKHQILMDFLGSSDLSLEERLELYSNTLEKMRSDFRAERAAQYRSIVQRGQSRVHTCSCNSPGSGRDCEYKYLYAPASGMQAIRSSVRVEGDNKGVSFGNGSVGLRMTCRGRNRSRGRLFADFHYPPSFISARVQREEKELFEIITNTDTSNFDAKRLDFPSDEGDYQFEVTAEDLSRLAPDADTFVEVIQSKEEE